ncbi:MAG: potassium-transporting ATPase subunit KdpC [Gammaproteobacteria bacterium]
MKHKFFQEYIRVSIISILFLTGLCGLAYPMLITSILAVFFEYEAQGSFIKQEEQLRGSVLLGQLFSSQQYFWTRPSATGGHPYDAAISSGSNLGPSNPSLLDAVNERIRVLQSVHSEALQIPIDLVTASGSGLDPDISIASAIYQSKRVATARQMEHAEVLKLIEAVQKKRQFKLLGEPRVNVVSLNLELDKQDLLMHEPG